VVKWLAVLVSCVALVLVAIGCGDDDEGDEDGGAATTEEPADGGGAGKAVKVSMKDIKFVPQDVTVSEGGTITWTNDDSPPHTVTKEKGPGPDFDSGNIDPGGNYKRTFNAAGKIDYVCTIHPNQTGTITVK
jgi:plastocyanin